jgi:hypothetical protein
MASKAEHEAAQRRTEELVADLENGGGVRARRRITRGAVQRALVRLLGGPREEVEDDEDTKTIPITP